MHPSELFPRLCRLSGFEKLKESLKTYISLPGDRTYMETPGDLDQFAELFQNEVHNIAHNGNECDLQFLEGLHNMTMASCGIMSHGQYKYMITENFEEFAAEMPELLETLIIWGWG